MQELDKDKELHFAKVHETAYKTYVGSSLMKTIIEEHFDSKKHLLPKYIEGIRSNLNELESLLK